ncbi:hypothetical protein KC19_1G028600 [Ceratodon purpureus]|uniref:Thiaminase-2/PQQC domain-containing protein n=2 Tax=Ceratodon purpureus TaxID=3225 RepID=A0A8T0J350_CERPU|nr:hypothetical protein KC19_1G028600 [Ceratodon purpureus]
MHHSTIHFWFHWRLALGPSTRFSVTWHRMHTSWRPLRMHMFPLTNAFSDQRMWHVIVKTVESPLLQLLIRCTSGNLMLLWCILDRYQMAMESTEDEDAKATIDSLKRDVEEELTLHSSVMQSLDADQTDFEPNTATAAYSDFLRAAATGCNRTLNLASTSAKIIAAMTPCMRLYAFLGQEIKKNINKVPDHPYQQWINTYSAADFEAAASKIEHLLDKLTESANKEDEKALLYNLYRRAMNLEVDFFSAQMLGPVHVPFFKSLAAPENRLLLVSDFDSTCTISDSCPVLADLTVQIAGKIPGGRSAGETEASLLRNKWDDLVMRYMDEYEEVLNRRLSNKEHGNGKAFTTEELQELLKEMSDFELKANARVEEAAVLKGLSPVAIQDAGKSMPLREGCSDFFKRLGLQEAHVDTHILSVCWSKTFIEAVLEQGEIHVANINANELVFNGNASTGKISFNVQTALDKQRHFIQIMDHLKGRQSTDPEHQQVHCVYIGDSLTDLLCLIRADVGIILGDSSTLKQVHGEKMTSLFRKALLLEQGNMPGSQQLSGCVFTVSSWYEVEAFLFGPAGSRVL